MNTKHLFRTAGFLLVSALSLQPSALLFAAPLGTAFTYQGRLADGGTAASGRYDFTFTLYDAASGGAPQVAPFVTNALPVTNGLFTAALDFGAPVFDGSARWVEISVKTNGAGSYSTLVPRQQLTPAPYALYAPSAGAAASASAVGAANITGTLALGQLPAAVVTNNATGVALGGSFSGNGSGLSSLSANNLSTGTLPDARLSTNVALLNTNQAFTGSNRFAGVVTATNVANAFVGAFTGNAAGLTNLSASQLATGTVPLGQLPAAVVTNSATAVTLAGTFSGDGSGLTNLSANLNQSSGNALTVGQNWGDGPLQVYGSTWTLDQQQTTLGYYFNDAAPWQSFTTGTNGSLAAIQAYVYSQSGADWTATLKTYAGEGKAGALLGSQSVAGSGVLQLRTFVLETPISLIVSNQYTFSFESASTTLRVRGAANVYAGGRADYGSGWDYYFLTYMINQATVPALMVQPNTFYVGIGKANPTSALDVNGTVTATAFAGNAAGLTNLDAADLTGMLADARLSTNVALLNTNQAFSGSNRFAGVVTMTNVANTLAGTFTGNGAGLTNLSASQLTTGTVPLGQLPAVVVTNNAPAVALAGSFTGNGGGLTNLSGAAIIAGTISSKQLAADSVDASKVVDGSIAAAELASDPASLAKVSGGAMAVTSGKIGIGVAAPSYPLTFANVLGDKISLWGNSGAHYGFGIQSSLLQIYSGASGGDIAFGCGESTNFTENVRFKGNGNVGIGTSTPSSTLDVNGMASADSLRVRGQSFLSAPLDVSGNAWTLDQDQDSYNGSTYGGAGMWQSFTAGTNGSLVGVALLYGATDGVSQWNTALAIYDGEGTGGSILSSQTVMGDGPVAWRQFSLNSPVMVSSGNKYTIHVNSDISCRWYKSTANPYAGGMGYYATNDDYCFRTYLDGGTSSPALTIQGGDGNVGIGTHTPGFPLTFANVLGDKISLWGQSGANYGFGIQGSQLQIHSDGSGSDVVFGYGQSTNFTENVRFKGNGNVGIGTNNPAQKLVVAGNIYATGTITPNSDRTLKTDFAPVDAAAVLDQVAALPIQQWRFQAEPEGVKHVGPMAQDFRAAFGLGEIPTAIATVDADGVALAAIQALNQKLEARSRELEGKGEKLRAENAALQARLEKLEQLLYAKPGGRQ